MLEKFKYLFCAVLTLQGAAVASDVWPEFRGPGGQGISTATNVPVCWSASNNIAWMAPIPGKGWSSPVLADAKVYLTTACEIDQSPCVSLRVLCLNADDGRLLWDTEAIRPDPTAMKPGHSKNSLASPTPIIHGNRLYAHFGHLGTACLSLDGKILWRQQSIKYPPMHGNGGSPVWVDSELVFNCDGESGPFVAALNAENGEVKWKTPRNTPARRKFSFSTPLVVGSGAGREIISPGSGFVGGYDLGGKEIWRFCYGEGFSVVPRPVIWGNLLFVTSGFDRPILYAISLNATHGDITTNHAAWHCSRQVPTTPSLIVAGEEIFFVSDGGIASCLDAKTGESRWTMRLGGDFSASPVCAEGRIYFQNEAGVGYVVKAAPEFESISTNDLGERSLASYAVEDNRLFIRTANHLWAIKN